VRGAGRTLALHTVNKKLKSGQNDQTQNYIAKSILFKHLETPAGHVRRPLQQTARRKAMTARQYFQDDKT
jgi:hypothetical protein